MSAPDPPRGTSPTRRFATGVGWLYAYRWGERLLDLVSIVVLARILAPEDFGLVAIAASVMAIIEGLSQFDVQKALIRIRDDPSGGGAGASRPLEDTAWTLSALRGLLSALVMLGIAAIASDGRIAAILALLALCPLLEGLANPRFVSFERDLIYSRLAALTLGSKLTAFALTLTVAVLYRTYWALVLGILAGAVTRLLLSYVFRPYRPRVSFARFSEIFAFSGWMSLTTAVTTLSMETDKLIVGRLLGVAEAGLYFMTQRVGVLPTRELISPLQRILFPSFAEIVENRPRLRRAVRESINVLGSLSLPAGCGFALVASDFVPLALGEQWTEIVPLLMILTPFLGFRGTLSMALPCVMALGRTRLLFWVSLAYALIHVPAFVAGTAWYGLTGSLVAIALAGLVYTYLNAWMLKRTLDVTASEILRALRRPLAATAAMAAAVAALDRLPLGLPSVAGSWLALSVEVMVGGAVYAGALFALWRLEGRPIGIEQRLLQLVK